MCDIGETEMALYTRSRFDKLGVPAFTSPEDAARAMKSLVSYGEYLQRNCVAEDCIKEIRQKRSKQI
jgi:acyl-CoA synthetase (NDP forming)